MGRYRLREDFCLGEVGFLESFSKMRVKRKELFKRERGKYREGSG